MSRDEEHLKLLSVFHYVLGGVTALFACFPFIHLILGVVMIVAPEVFEEGEPPPAFLGWLFAIMGATCIVFGWAFAILALYAGRCLAKRRRYIYCLIVAALSCLFMPLGTVLGVFTIIVLIRPSVKELFATGQIAQAPEAE